MLSYHRVLAAFGRSVRDKNIECNLDIHPWEITINGNNWAGKIRLIGFVDVFFVIAYSANDCFMRGVIVYKDPQALGVLSKRIVPESGRMPEPSENDANNSGDSPEGSGGKLWDDNGYYYDSSDSGFDTDFTDEEMSDSDENNKDEGDNSTQAEGEKRDQQPKEKVNFQARSVYTASSLGHEISLKATFSAESIKTYTVKVNRPASLAMSRRMKRALKTHGVLRMMQDAVRSGLITQGQLIGHVTGLLFTGGRLSDTVSRAFQATSGDNAQRHTLSNENI